MVISNAELEAMAAALPQEVLELLIAEMKEIIRNRPEIQGPDAA